MAQPRYPGATLDPQSYASALESVNRDFQTGATTLAQYANDMASLGRTIDGVALQFQQLQINNVGLTQGINATGQAFNALSGVMNNAYDIVNNVVDMMKGNVDEQVNMYDAQINTIYAQNRYTQALALHATAVQMFGSGSIQASQTQISLNYQQALLGQAQKNQTVTTIQYQTAYINNIAQVGAAASQTATQLLVMVAALRVLGATSMIGGAGGAAGAAGAGGMMTMAGTALGVAGGGIAGYGLGTMAGQAIGGQQGGIYGGIGGALAGTAIMGVGLGLAPETLGLSLLAAGLISSEPLWGKYLGLPSFQHGGMVEKTGPAYLHAGERVVPKGEANTTSVPITIYASSEVDLSKVRQIISEEIAKAQLKTMRSRGGVY